MTTRRLVLNSLALAAIGQVPVAALAQDAAFPSGQMRIVAPAPPGGGTDRLARLIANELVKRMGAQVLVENKSGANGSIGGEYVSRATNDGRTLLVAYMGAITISPHLVQSKTYNPVEDLEPLTRIVTYPLIAVVHPGVRANSLAELVALARRPDGVSYGSAGIGSGAHLTGAAFNLKHGTRFIHVPYQGSKPSVTDLLAGRLDVLFETPDNVNAYIEAGQLRAIAISRDKRHPKYPDVATFEEQGFAGLAPDGWYGVFAPKNTPKALLNTLHRELAAVIRTPAVAGQLETQGLDPAPSASAEQFRDYVRTESGRMALLVKASGAKAN